MYTLDALLTHAPERILFAARVGSHAHGTATPESDEDVRGLFAVPAREYLALAAPPEQVGDERSNVVYYSLRRALELLAAANPTIFELLWVPDDCVLWTSPEMAALVARRDLFLTQRCAETHVGYARAQIRRARGQNKWINNPQPEEPPKREDYCFVILPLAWGGASQPTPAGPPASGEPSLPGRPVPLAELGWDLARYHASRVEHARELYRLYHYGAEARGVFRGEDHLVCEPIPKEDELRCFAGLLLYNRQAFEGALADHRNYWGWRANRNEARWRQQERGELDYDAKNLMHTVRLLLSGRSILTRGTPIVRFEGEGLVLLRSIRAGEKSYDEILALADALVADCERAVATCSLPDHADAAAVEALLAELTARWESRR